MQSVEDLNLTSLFSNLERTACDAQGQIRQSVAAALEAGLPFGKNVIGDGPFTDLYGVLPDIAAIIRNADSSEIDGPFFATRLAFISNGVYSAVAEYAKSVLEITLATNGDDRVALERVAKALNCNSEDNSAAPDVDWNGFVSLLVENVDNIDPFIDGVNENAHSLFQRGGHPPRSCTVTADDRDLPVALALSLPAVVGMFISLRVCEQLADDKVKTATHLLWTSLQTSHQQRLKLFGPASHRLTPDA